MSLEVHHGEQRMPAEDAAGHKGLLSPQGLILPEFQALLDAVDAPLDNMEKNQLTRFLKDHERSLPLKENHPATQTRSSMTLQWKNTLPIKQSVRRPSIKQKEQAQTEVDWMLAQGITEPSNFPWAFPMVHAQKDSSLQYCIDDRQISTITCKYS